MPRPWTGKSCFSTIPALIITVGKFIPNHLFNHYSYRFQLLWIYFFYSYRFSSFGFFFLQLQVSSFCAEAVLWTQHSTIFRNSGWKWLPTKFSHFQPKFSQIQPFSAQNMAFFGWKWLSLAEEFNWFSESLAIKSVVIKVSPFPVPLNFSHFRPKTWLFLAGNGWIWLNFGWKWLTFGWKRLNFGRIGLKTAEIQGNRERRDLDHYRIDCQRFWELQCQKLKMK